MISKMRKINDGFIALIAVILLAAGTLAFSLVTMSAAYSYSDSIIRRELRIQAELNAKACLDSATLMVAKDYFLSGTVTISEFGCTVSVTNNLGTSSTISISATSTLEGVKASGGRILTVTDNSVVVTFDSS